MHDASWLAAGFLSISSHQPPNLTSFRVHPSPCLSLDCGVISRQHTPLQSTTWSRPPTWDRLRFPLRSRFCPPSSIPVLKLFPRNLQVFRRDGLRFPGPARHTNAMPQLPDGPWANGKREPAVRVDHGMPSTIDSWRCPALGKGLGIARAAPSLSFFGGPGPRVAGVHADAMRQPIPSIRYPPPTALPCKLEDSKPNNVFSSLPVPCSFAKHMLENRRRDATVILQSHPRVSACAVHEHPLEDSVDPYL